MLEGTLHTIWDIVTDAAAMGEDSAACDMFTRVTQAIQAYFATRTYSTVQGETQ